MRRRRVQVSQGIDAFGELTGGLRDTSFRTQAQRCGSVTMATCDHKLGRMLLRT
jgi:hypothetical protein